MRYFGEIFVLCIVAYVLGYCTHKIINKNKIYELNNKYVCEQSKAKRYLNDMRLDLFMVQWKVSGNEFNKMLKIHNYKKIAIYGGANVGKVLYCFLKETDTTIQCIIDKNKLIRWIDDVSVITLEEVNKDLDVDAIIVTPLVYYDEIYEELKNRIDCPIIPICDILGDE